MLQKKKLIPLSLTTVKLILVLIVLVSFGLVLAAGYLTRDKVINIRKQNSALFGPSDEESAARRSVEMVEKSLPEIRNYYDNVKNGVNTQTGYRPTIALDRKEGNYYVVYFHEDDTNPPSMHKEKPMSVYYWVDVDAGIIKDAAGNVLRREKAMDYKTYRNGKYGFEFQYPAIFDETKEHQSCELKESTGNFDPSLFVSVAGRVWLQVLDSDGLTLSEYVDKRIKTAGLKIESRKLGTIDNSSAEEIIYSISGSEGAGEMAFLLNDNNIYSFSLERPNSGCDSEVDNISMFSVYMKLISTFKFTEKDPLFSCGTSIVTDIDNNTYKTIQIGSQCWMRENLKVAKNSQGEAITRYCYNDDPAICGTDGGLYDWNTVMNNLFREGTRGICPDGWHVPRDSELYVLESGTKLKAEDSFGSESVFAGIRNADGVFSGRGTVSYYWYSTESGSNARSRFLKSGSDTANRLMVDKAFSLSVRCIKD